MAESEKDMERIIAALMEENAELQANVDALSLTYADLLLHSVPESEDLGGIVVHPDRAAVGPCDCYGNVCFHKGIIGALNSQERGQYCHEVEQEHSKAMTDRLARWHESVEVCKGEIAGVPKGQRLTPWLTCMSKELPKHGVTS